MISKELDHVSDRATKAPLGAEANRRHSAIDKWSNDTRINKNDETYPSGNEGKRWWPNVMDVRVRVVGTSTGDDSEVDADCPDPRATGDGDVGAEML